MTNLTWEWIAGFFEGEGNISWIEGKASGAKHASARIQIGQKSKAPLQAIYDFLLANAVARPYLNPRRAGKASSKAKARPIAIWILSIQYRPDVITFLEHIRPTLIEKQRKADFVLGKLAALNDKRESIMARAIELKRANKSWRAISDELGIGRRAVMNYAIVKGISLESADKREDDLSIRDYHVSKGRCEICRKPCGKDGTKRKCRACADAYNAWRNEHRRIHGRE